jgi:hypothetical protein
MSKIHIESKFKKLLKTKNCDVSINYKSRIIEIKKENKLRIIPFENIYFIDLID